MFRRLSLGALLLSAVVLPLTSCSNPSGLDSISISPASPSLTAGQSVQFSAVGTYGNGSHPTTQTITSGVTWNSSNPAVATIDAAGLATTLAAGTTTITASTNGFKGPLTASTSITVTVTTTGGGAGGSVTSVSVTPAVQTALTIGQTAPFTAVGTTSTGATELLTTAATWTSSNTGVATIVANTGVATAVATGTTTITASYTNTASGAAVNGTAQFTVTGGTTTGNITALTLTPSSESLSASGGTGQLIAIGTVAGSGAQEDVTNSSQITWTSNIPTIAIVNASATPGGPAVPGLVQGVSAGTATIFAEYKNASDGSLATATATITITSTPAPEPLLSLSIIPNSITVGNLQDTGQFLAIGTFAVAPYVRDVTNDKDTTWLSSFPNDFPVGTNSGGSDAGTSAGLVTAYASGNATIIAEYQNPSLTDPTIQTALATFNCPLALPNPGGNPPTAGTCNVGQPGPLLATLTVYAQGLNTTNWLITAPSATGTADVIHCGPGWAADGNTGGSVCTATYPVGTTVTLTAPSQTGVNFGGWSQNCTNTAPITQTGQNSCTVTLTGVSNIDGSGSVNATVAGIFN